MRYTRWTSRGQRTGQVGSAAEEGEEPRTLLNFPFFADSFHVQETEDGRTDEEQDSAVTCTPCIPTRPREKESHGHGRRDGSGLI